jgi:hypothetical protein
MVEGHIFQGASLKLPVAPFAPGHLYVMLVRDTVFSVYTVPGYTRIHTFLSLYRKAQQN